MYLKKNCKKKKKHQKPRADLEENKIQYVFIIMIENAGNNIVFTCKAHYINCIFKKNLDLILQVAIRLKTNSSLSKEKILQNQTCHVSVWNIFNIPDNQNEIELPYLCRIPIRHKNPYKQIKDTWRVPVNVLSNLFLYASLTSI